ncbi:MAG: DUF1501 domain-containing protein [Pseudomonadota bacterium]|nr:DUF1501 domain-containing protein [Pseudomonadota bacterium]
MSNSTRDDRRTFLRRMRGMLAGGAALALMPQLELVGRALAAEPPAGSDYRALVCIFLFGGNDSFNMLIPHDSAEHRLYLTSRGGVYDGASNALGLGIARDQLVRVTDRSGRNWGLHPSCGAMKGLFDRGELAFLANVGTLVEPVTKQDVTGKSKPLPPYLYSHNDQQRLWMRGHSGRGASIGWGGMSADRLRAANAGGLVALPPSISIAGSNLFQFGESTMPFAMSSGGPAVLNRFRTDGGTNDRIRGEALRALVEAPYSPIMSDQYSVLGESAIVLNDTLRNALAPANGGDIATVFPGGNLSAQLRMIARMIKASRTSAIGHRRQVYFASMGGFDTHQNQMLASGHGALLGQLGSSLAAFREALVEIGALNNVTSFTMSDFGRTLNSNGNGTDHGWGGVQLMMGGAAANGGSLRGQQVWGNYPLLELNGEQAVGRGRMVPTTSVNQMGATMAQWLGVPSAELPTIFPGINNFSPSQLGFLG